MFSQEQDKEESFPTGSYPSPQIPLGRTKMTCLASVPYNNTPLQLEMKGMMIAADMARARD